jgi:hypothetical protein
VKVGLPSKEGTLFCSPSENHMAGSTFRLEYRGSYNVLELCFRRFNGSMDESPQVPFSFQRYRFNSKVIRNVLVTGGTFRMKVQCVVSYVQWVE